MLESASIIFPISFRSVIFVVMGVTVRLCDSDVSPFSRLSFIGMLMYWDMTGSVYLIPADS